MTTSDSIGPSCLLSTPIPAPRKSRGRVVGSGEVASQKTSRFTAFDSTSALQQSLCQSRAQIFERLSFVQKQRSQESQSLMNNQKHRYIRKIAGTSCQNNIERMKTDNFAHPKLSQGNTGAPSKSDHPSESSTSEDDDDTEDSVDRILDKPKPGRLDLSQFDNITNAIGKLKIQNPTKAMEDSTNTQLKPTHESSQQESSLFKNRSKKSSKNRTTKENKNKQAITSSATAKTSSSAAQVPSSTSFATPGFVSGSSVPIGSTAAKRLGNPRHNHGRAVAPPQLPETSNIFSGSSIDPSSRSGDGSVAQPIITSSNEQQPLHESVSRLVGSDSTRQPDFSQSPIARRLLKHSLDHKVSEIVSPYGSATELSQSLDSSGSQKSHLGQNLGLDNAFPGQHHLFASSSIDSSELISARGATIRQLNEILSSKQLSGRQGLTAGPASRSSSFDQDQEQQQKEPQQSNRKGDKNNKKDKKKLRDYEKSEKRRLKEEERQRSKEKKLAAKKSKPNAPGGDGSVGDDGIPFFIRRCIEFIEDEGLDAEGIYRVPGNRAHVDAFVQKFKENPDIPIDESDVPVNAVATALKDFLSKKWGPIVPLDLMNELTESSSIPEKDQRVKAVRRLVHKLPPSNYNLLKYVIAHFVRVSMNHSLNSMDSKNLAICWWPTLLPLHFSDMVMFEQMRPHLEESIQTMIDQYDFIFDTDAPESSSAP